MDPDRWLERQERELDEQLQSGSISRTDYDREMRLVQQEYREMARESAQNAYDRELDRW